MPSDYFFAWWNLENLFDVEGAPLSRRSEKVKRAIGNDIKGWTQALLNSKVAQLTSVISYMNNDHGPDLLGVCEVENEHCMDMLVQGLAPLGRRYQIVHHDTPDQRGIDVAFIYDADLFTAQDVFFHVIRRRTATRDLLQVNFITTKGRLLVIVGNHWPARSGGELASAGYRAIAGETLAYFHQRIWEVKGNATPVLAMGDFNDEPFDPSLVDYALSTRSRQKVLKARTPRLFNLMWDICGNGEGTFYFDNFPNVLDQFLADKNLLKENAPLRVQVNSASIIRFPGMVSTGDYPQPIPFGGMGKPVNQAGFSDHFPIAVKLAEKD